MYLRRHVRVHGNSYRNGVCRALVVCFHVYYLHVHRQIFNNTNLTTCAALNGLPTTRPDMQQILQEEMYITHNYNSVSGKQVTHNDTCQSLFYVSN